MPKPTDAEMFESLLECRKRVDNTLLAMEATGMTEVVEAYNKAYEVLEKALTEAAEKIAKANPEKVQLYYLGRAA
jgi:hypothetical protein